MLSLRPLRPSSFDIRYSSFFRPRLLRLVLAALAVTLASAPSLRADAAATGQAAALGQLTERPTSPNTHPDAQWFPEAGLGLFIHWGIASTRATGDLSWAMLANKPWKDQTVTPRTYYAAIQDWKPDHVDYDAMLGAAKAAGFTYAVMVTKHHDGFTLWPSEVGEIGTKHTFGGRDFVREFVEACRKHGLRVGLYFSPPDWWFERAYKNFNYAGEPAFDLDHQPTVLPPRTPAQEAERVAMIRTQVTELLTRYGQIDLLWFDGGGGEMPNTEVRRLQPGIVINKRNRARGDYNDSEVTFPAKRFSGWFETCSTCWPTRKWAYTDAFGFDPAHVALTKLVLLRAWGGNLLANLGPKGDGSIPAPALECWADMAAWMSHSRESVIGTRGGPWPEQANLPITTRDRAAYLHFLPALPDFYPETPANIERSRTRGIMPALPDSVSEAVWRDAPRPARVLLLRTGAELPFRYENNTLTVTLPPEFRTGSVDVVKVELAP